MLIAIDFCSENLGFFLASLVTVSLFSIEVVVELFDVSVDWDLVAHPVITKSKAPKKQITFSFAFFSYFYFSKV